MTRLVLIPVAAIAIGLAACADKGKDAPPTAPKAGLATTADITPAIAPSVSNSTVCLSYQNKRAIAEARLKRAKEIGTEAGASGPDARTDELEKEVSKLNMMVSDTCN